MKNSIKKSISTLCLSCVSVFVIAQTGGIKGQIKNNELEPLFGVTVKITQGGVLVGGTVTDADGYYTYKPLNPGLYEAIIQSTEIQTQRLTQIKINTDRTTYVDFKANTNDLTGVTVTATFNESIIDKNICTMQSIDANTFLHSSAGPRGDIKAVIASVSSDVKLDEDGSFHVRGSRGGATDYVIDGVRTPNLQDPAALSVENVSMITGGIPAQYGDCLGGVIVITTKNYMDGIREKRRRNCDLNERLVDEKLKKDAEFNEEKRKKEIEEEIRLEESRLKE